jgi:hypothetical protein
MHRVQSVCAALAYNIFRFVSRPQFGNAETGLDAEYKKGTIPQCVLSVEAVAYQKYFGVCERASAFHGSTKRRRTKRFALFFSWVL